jgi:hypothetical protein
MIPRFDNDSDPDSDPDAEGTFDLAGCGEETKAMPDSYDQSLRRSTPRQVAVLPRQAQHCQVPRGIEFEDTWSTHPDKASLVLT